MRGRHTLTPHRRPNQMGRCLQVALAVEQGGRDGRLLQYAAARAASWLVTDLPAHVEAALFPKTVRTPVRVARAAAMVGCYSWFQCVTRSKHTVSTQVATHFDCQVHLHGMTVCWSYAAIPCADWTSALQGTPLTDAELDFVGRLWAAAPPALHRPRTVSDTPALASPHLPLVATRLAAGLSACAA